MDTWTDLHLDSESARSLSSGPALRERARG